MNTLNKDVKTEKLERKKKQNKIEKHRKLKKK
jgi:hypothetical protein